MPVLQPRPGSEEVAAALSRGFSGRLLRLYYYEQAYLQRQAGITPEPTYLLLSNNEGGFPRFGFFLEKKAKPDVGFVDLHENGGYHPTGCLALRVPAAWIASVMPAALLTFPWV